LEFILILHTFRDNLVHALRHQGRGEKRRGSMRALGGSAVPAPGPILGARGGAPAKGHAKRKNHSVKLTFKKKGKPPMPYARSSKSKGDIAGNALATDQSGGGDKDAGERKRYWKKKTVSRP